MREALVVLLVAFVTLLGLNLFFKGESPKPQVLQKDSVITVVKVQTIVDTVLLLQEAVLCTVYINSTPHLIATLDTTLVHDDGSKDSLDIKYYLYNNMFRLRNKHIGVVKTVETTKYITEETKFAMYSNLELMSGSGKYEGALGFDGVFYEKYVLGVRVGTNKMLGLNLGIRIK